MIQKLSQGNQLCITFQVLTCTTMTISMTNLEAVSVAHTASDTHFYYSYFIRIEIIIYF